MALRSLYQLYSGVVLAVFLTPSTQLTTTAQAPVTELISTPNSTYSTVNTTPEQDVCDTEVKVTAAKWHNKSVHVTWQVSRDNGTWTGFLVYLSKKAGEDVGMRICKTREEERSCSSLSANTGCTESCRVSVQAYCNSQNGPLSSWTTVSLPSEDRGNYIYFYIGGGVGGAVLLFVIILTIILCRRRKKKRQTHTFNNLPSRDQLKLEPTLSSGSSVIPSYDANDHVTFGTLAHQREDNDKSQGEPTYVNNASIRNQTRRTTQDNANKVPPVPIAEGYYSNVTNEADNDNTYSTPRPTYAPDTSKRPGSIPLPTVPQAGYSSLRY